MFEKRDCSNHQASVPTALADTFPEQSTRLIVRNACVYQPPIEILSLSLNLQDSLVRDHAASRRTESLPCDLVEMTRSLS